MKYKKDKNPESDALFQKYWRKKNKTKQNNTKNKNKNKTKQKTYTLIKPGHYENSYLRQKRDTKTGTPVPDKLRMLVRALNPSLRKLPEK